MSIRGSIGRRARAWGLVVVASVLSAGVWPATAANAAAAATAGTAASPTSSTGSPRTTRRGRALRAPAHTGYGETHAERQQRLQRECRGKPNTGACEGYGG